MKEMLFSLLFFVSATVPALEVPEELRGKTIQVIVPYGPGGQSDVSARELARVVERKTGINVTVINKPGAGGTIGTNFLASSSPTGLVVGQMETQSAIFNTVSKQTGSTPLSALVPVSASFESSLALVVSTSVPHKSIKEFVSYLKENKNRLSFPTTGALHSLWSNELLQRMDAVGVQSVLYKSNPEAVRSLLANETAFYLIAPSEVEGLVKSGKLVILAMGSKQRIPTWPDVPTLNETFPGMFTVNYNGLYAPTGTPKHMVTFLNEAWDKAVWDGEIVANYHKRGHKPLGGDLQKTLSIYNSYVKQRSDQYNKFGNLIK
jgi:tripartite-type tricarboxylate transporter receptor subunit TctC